MCVCVCVCETTREQHAIATGTGELHERVWDLAADALMVLCIITSVVGLLLWQALDTHCLGK